MPPDSLQHWHHAEQLLGARRFDAAGDAYRALLADPLWALPACLRLSTLARRAGQVRESVALALAAWSAAPQERDAVLVEAVCRQLFEIGEIETGLACARLPVLAESRDPTTLATVGNLLLDFALPDAALVMLRRARAQGMDSPALRYQLGLALMYAGDLAAAEDELEQCLRAAPDYLPAWRVRSRLRRQTPERNHVDALRAVIVRTPVDHPDAPLLQYALFKELDDLDDTVGAWAALETGMRQRRRQVNHDAAAEAALFQHLRTVYPRAGEGTHTDGPVPIFIIGMPRSGTTLLERILGAHPQVAGAGELRDFTTQLRWSCDRMGGLELDLPLALAADSIDFAELGRRYLEHTQWWAGGRGFYTDKLPANFVHAGHIAKALPQARILHMLRAPMDTCFSNLKELFAGAYPHSYDQREMADHYVQYRALMDHWHHAFPGRVLDVHYERLVAEPEAVAREVLDFCGLSWIPSVVDIQQERGAVATASTVQVREPIHQRFLGQWRRYESHLGPLRERLGALAY